MLIKNEIPILEFDSDKSAVITPDHEKLNIKLPERCVYAFLGNEMEKYAAKVGTSPIAHFESETKLYPVYVIEHNGEPITLCQAPVGAAAAAQILDWLIGYGVRKIISSGSCGALCDFEEGCFLVPRRALRDEGTSYHYAPPSRYIETNEKVREAIKDTLLGRGIKYREVTTWSTDGFYRETREKVEYRKAEGCETVEMECSALAACAEFRGTEFGMILYTADTLADIDKYDERHWGGDIEEYALELCLDAVLRL